MVAVESLPKVVPKNSDTLSSVLLDAPAVLRQIASEWVEEFTAVKCFVPCNKILLFVVFRASEMPPARQIECFACGYATERFIENYLVQRSVFKRPLRYWGAWAVDLVNDKWKAVKFSQVLWLEYDSMQGIDDLGCFVRLKDHAIKLSREECAKDFEFRCVRGLRVGQAWEDKVRRWSPVKLFLWERSLLRF